MHIKVLDHGFVELYKFYGGEDVIAEIARKSHDSVSTPEGDIRLIKNQVKKHHTTPFEFSLFIFYICCPEMVFRHFVRHRTATFVVKSLRYTSDEPVFYMPDSNRLDESLATVVKETYDHIARVYNMLLEKGTKPEVARIVLPQGTYVTFYMSIDPHNLIDVILEQRLAQAAQYETRLFAQAIAKIVKSEMPHAWEAAAKKYGWSL